MREDLQKYIDTIPAVGDASRLEETFWLNDHLTAGGEKRLRWFARSRLKMQKKAGTVCTLLAGGFSGAQRNRRDD